MNSNPKQPLYVAPEERVTLDQLKQRVETISDLAITESRRLADEVREEALTKTALIAVGAIVVAVSLGYLIAARACRRRAADDASRIR